jgi:integrase
MDQELKRSKRLGALAPVATSQETVADFAKVWWARYVVPNLQRHTQLAYASMLDVHIIPAIGDLPLRSLNAEALWDLRAQMSGAGVGDGATRKTLVVIQSMLQRAVEWRHIESNPAKLVRKPSQTRTRVVRPLSPEQVEAIRAALLEGGREADAALVAVLAYAGLRPGEALGLRWHDIRERTILVERSVAFGKLKSTKTGKSRTVRLLAPLAETLDAWRETTDRREPTDLIFPGPDGAPWNLDRINNWRGRIFADATKAAGILGVRPYDLRHSYISLLIAQGESVVAVAQQAGHSPTMALSTYAHLFDEHDRRDNRSAEELIRAARTLGSVRDVSVLCPPKIGLETRDAGNACKPRVGDPGFEPGTSSLSEIAACCARWSRVAPRSITTGAHARRTHSKNTPARNLGCAPVAHGYPGASGSEDCRQQSAAGTYAARARTRRRLNRSRCGSHRRTNVR